MKKKKVGNNQCRTYKANVPIPLGKTKIKVAVRGTILQVTAKPMLRLVPNPSLAIEFEAPRYSRLATLGDISPSVQLVKEGVKLDIIPVSLSSGKGKLRGILIPHRQPCTALRKARQQLQSAQFSVLNFSEFFGKQDRSQEGKNGGSWRSGAAQMIASPWRVNLVAVPNLKDLKATLQKDGGYAVTHTGTVQQEDSKTFSVKEAERFLEGLRLFLSFARGAFCSLTLQRGLNRKGEEVWKQWGAHIVMPWSYMPSWFDTMNGQILSEVFPGFWKCFNNSEWKETISVVLYWYLRSNAHGHGAGVDGGLIFTQAALERLAANLGHSGKASAKIRKALIALGIEPVIPNSCRKLRALARKHKWHDVPHALTEIRNDLTHPEQKYGNMLKDSYYEAWNLGQWYVELILLRLFNYNGQYGNRITQQWRGEVSSVPWA